MFNTCPVSHTSDLISIVPPGQNLVRFLGILSEPIISFPPVINKVRRTVSVSSCQHNRGTGIHQLGAPGGVIDVMSHKSTNSRKTRKFYQQGRSSPVDQWFRDFGFFIFLTFLHWLFLTFFFFSLRIFIRLRFGFRFQFLFNFWFGNLLTKASKIKFLNRSKVF